MLKRKSIVIGFLAFCLVATLLIGVTSSAEYDPWCDINDDGVINILDIVSLGIRFDEEGTPINKTELLLNLNATVEALETRIPKKGNISVAAAAFVPSSDVKHWANIGWSLYNQDVGTVSFFASVQLPHGATITKLTFYWYDAGDNYIQCFLYRFEQGVSYKMLNATSTGSAGYGSSDDDTIYSPWATVDNNQYAYLMKVEIPPSPSHLDYIFQYAFIEYEYPI